MMQVFIKYHSRTKLFAVHCAHHIFNIKEKVLKITTKKILSTPLALLCIFNISYGMDDDVPELVPNFLYAPYVEEKVKQNNSGAVAAFLQTNFDRRDASIKLLDAAKHNDTKSLKLLASHPEISTSVKDDDGCTPLLWCCRNNYNDGVNLLLSRSNHDVDTQDYNGNTPLHASACTGNRSITKALLQNGASTTIKNNEQKTALANCFTWGQTQALDPADLQQAALSTDVQGNTQIHLYATTQIFGADSYLEFLMQHGVSLWSQNLHGKTAIDLAHEEYCHTLQEYKRKRIHKYKEILENQLCVWHMFLRVFSKRTSCAAFKEMFTLFCLLPETQKSIMLYYYKLNVETVIARKHRYSTRDEYYGKTIEQQEKIKQQLIDLPETPHLLWRDC